MSPTHRWRTCSETTRRITNHRSATGGRPGGGGGRIRAAQALEQDDIVRIDFTPSTGHEPAKKHPALVMSGYGFNSRSSLICVVPITSRNNGYPLHIPVRGGAVCGFACVEQMRTLDLDYRGFSIAGAADDDSMRRVMGAIREMLELR